MYLGGRKYDSSSGWLGASWRSLWNFVPAQFARPKRTQTLREMFPDHVENELHLIVTSMWPFSEHS